MLPSFLICGLEHSGTTLVSDLFRQVDGVDSGFECGVLLCECPEKFADFQPFASHMVKGWGVTQAEFEDCCKAPDFGEFYDRLSSSSRVLKPDVRRIFDKTPRYLSALEAVTNRAGGRPIIVTFKDPRAIVASDFKRASAQDFNAWYGVYRPSKIAYLRTCYAEHVKAVGWPNVHCLSLEGLAMNARQVMERMFRHVGLEFRLKHTVLHNLRYKNTRGMSVQPEVVFDYLKVLSPVQQDQVSRDFGEFSQWFYH
ncbi:sulfotransferase [Pseudooceanicola aestuarii]|uniref:sulfotransferase n=1 Tax=Pseudooceanicola aestuarii TaxID=2697319 RepID=UPI0013D12728|nr:sulfotransferase [Pseudooceanicola aestuarii]